MKYKYIDESTQHIKVAITDLNGVLRAKYLSKAKFLSAIEHDFGFCDVIVGVDIDDQLVDSLHSTGWHTGYPDATVTIIKNSARQLVFEDNRPLYLCEFSEASASLCPRQLLKSQVKKASAHQLQAIAGIEFEFTLFNETPDSAHAKGFQQLQPLTPGNCGYSLLRTSQLSEFYDELLEVCAQMDIPLEGLHTEIGPGVLEAAIEKGPVLETADRAVLFKSVVKTLAHRRGWSACFMAKWSELHQGQSGHIHLSFLDEKGNAVFYDEHSEQTISPLMQQAIAGQQQLMPELLLLNAPFVNSYARLVPGFWAPTQASWGIDNRTCSLRAITGGEKSNRIEYRVPGADCNPYLAMTAAIASAVYGIENKLAPTPAIKGNAYEQPLNSEYVLPTDMSLAIQRFKTSEIARESFGDTFVDDYATLKQHEVTKAQAAVTDWQLKRYFELA